MNVGKPVEEGIPEAVVDKVVDPLAVAHVQAEGDVLRLAVKGLSLIHISFVIFPSAFTVELPFFF